MNTEKLIYLDTFIILIDKAIKIAEDRKLIMPTSEFHKKLRQAGWITQEDIDKGQDFLEKKYEYIFEYQWLENNIILSLKHLKERAQTTEFCIKLKELRKGSRNSLPFTRGISEAGHNMWADELYDYAIYNACHEVEKYFSDELE